MAVVNFFSQNIRFKIPKPAKISQWIKLVAAREGYKLKEINYIFCTDEALRELNMRYLQHKTYTDIITFDNSDTPHALEADVFISIDRVKENAEKLKIPFPEELHRVIVHGLLHLIGYSDKTPRKKVGMRKKEDAYLSLR
jgi:probable rRNA maturation factor